MTKTPISLQDLRRRIYVKAKAEPSWRFWGLYVHVCKMETLRAAYAMAKENNGAPGIDGVTFEAIEAQGVEAFLEQIRDELVTRSIGRCGTGGRRYRRTGAKVRVLSIPCDSGPRGPGCAQAHPGAHLRGRLPTGVVWLPTEADSARGGQPGRRGDRAGQDARHRHRSARPTSTTCGMICCSRRWPGGSTTTTCCTCSR